jgi:hypothetical protein
MPLKNVVDLSGNPPGRGFRMGKHCGRLRRCFLRRILLAGTVLLAASSARPKNTKDNTGKKTRLRRPGWMGPHFVSNQHDTSRVWFHKQEIKSHFPTIPTK